MKKLLLLFAVVLLLSACAKKEEKKKDNFLDTTETKVPERIKLIEGSQWSYFQIVEVDGHQYLTNGNHGGIVHLESCSCKKK